MKLWRFTCASVTALLTFSVLRFYRHLLQACNDDTLDKEIRHALDPSGAARLS